MDALRGFSAFRGRVPSQGLLFCKVFLFSILPWIICWSSYRDCSFEPLLGCRDIVTVQASAASVTWELSLCIYWWDCQVLGSEYASIVRSRSKVPLAVREIFSVLQGYRLASAWINLLIQWLTLMRIVVPSGSEHHEGSAPNQILRRSWREIISRR